MNDRPLPPSDAPDPGAHELAASAWADGTATPEEAALVRDHPETARLADRMRDVTREVARVEPVAAETVEGSIEAALAQFDQRSAQDVRPVHAARAAHGASPGSAATRWFRPAMAAAAVLLIGVAGVVVVNGIGGGSDDDVADAPASIDAASTFESAVDDAADPPPDDADAAGGSELRTMEGDAAPEVAQDRDDAADAAETDGASDAESDTEFDRDAASDATPTAAVVLTGADTLVAWVEMLLDADPTATDPNPEAERSSCPPIEGLEHERVLGWARHADDEVFVVTDGRIAVAVDPLSCTEVLRATLRD